MQHFYKQRQAEIDKKLNNTLRLNFCYLKIIYILHPRYYPTLIGRHILKKQVKEQVRLYSYDHS